MGKVHHPQYDLRLSQFLVGFLNAHILYDVGAFAYSGCVGQANGDALYVDGVFYYIACGAMDIAYDGAPIVCQQIQQRRLADIGFANDSYGDAVLQCVAQAECLRQCCDFRQDVSGQCGQLFAVGKLQVFVVGKVQFQFHQCGQMKEFFAKEAQFVADAAPQLVHGHPVSG